MGYTAPIPLGDPPSLLELSARFCIDNLGVTLGSKLALGLKEGIVLPEAVCQTLLDVADKELEGFENLVVPIFQDPSRTRLSKLCLRSSIISTSGFTSLLKHYPYTIDISNCVSLNPEALKAINKYSANLHTLTIGNATQIFPELLPREDGTSYEPIINAPKLRMLSIHEYIGEGGFWKALLPTYSQLTHLDLSGCGEVDGLDFLKTAENLIWLNLYNVGVGDEGLRIVAKCKGLRHLDVSQSNESSSVFQYTRETLTNIIQSLPNLTSLDISGTNLAGRGVAESSENCDIPGLESRVGNPLEFLGLYGSLHDASHRHHIPAKRIAGDKDEAQILVACQAYLDRSELLEKILNDLFHLFRADKGTKIQLSLELILEAMNRHLGEKHVQISGSASLFYIFKNSDKGSIDQLTKKKILSTLIAAMEIHKFDATMMRNGCLTICLFHVPQDVLFQYEKLVRVLLEILGGSGLQEDFVERIAIYLLNSLACQVEGPQKLLVGELGAITKMLELIRIRLGKNECDDVMEIAWSTMWNVTDETEQNCRLFLDGNGMDLFLQCLTAFPTKAELLRNMMGLLGNVAEVPSLRPRLMNKDFISVFYRLLDSTQDNIEVSYNAAGVLAHILSDGDKAWTIAKPLRKEVMEKLSTNVQRWDVSSQRNINYRSFEPILRLLSVDVSVCRLWSAWALANLTRVYPDKYCPLLVAENGLKLLLPLTSEPGGVGMYATMALDNVAVENAKNKNGQEAPMQTD